MRERPMTDVVTGAVVVMISAVKQKNPGVLYTEGEEIERDAHKAEEWYKQARDGGTRTGVPT